MIPEPVLLPRPRSMELGDDWCPNRQPTVQIDPHLHPQGYRLTVRPDDVRLTGGSPAGVANGHRTLGQLTRVYGEQLPRIRIDDEPDIEVRGVMLDVSRDKVPTLHTLKALVDRLASWKVNHLQLYMEHTFAYPQHRVVWSRADPYTAGDVAELEAHCRQRHVELTMNQNCLGHMERWLRHEPYRTLAVSPNRWTDRRGRTRAPTTLDPAKPGSLDLVRGLLAELLPCSPSRRVHVGLDEPFELPDERMDEYLDYLLRMRALPELEAHEVLVWGDIVAGHPAWLSSIPEGVTICEWGYEANHRFEVMSSRLADAGVPFWTCPGTSSWNTLVGRFSNACENLRGAAAAAIEHGAEGMLVTDWGDNGHLQYLPVSEPLFAYGASVAWCLEANADVDLAPALDLHVLDEPTGNLSAAMLTLGDAHTLVRPQVPNSSSLVMHLYWPQLRVGEGFTEGLTPEDLSDVERTIAGAVARLDRATPKRTDGDLILDELRASAALLGVLCRDARARVQAQRTLESVSPTIRAELAAALEPLVDKHRRLWLARNRAGGLDDSSARLDGLLAAYRAGV